MQDWFCVERTLLSAAFDFDFWGAGPPLRFGSMDDHNLRLPHPCVFCVKSQHMLYKLSRDILYSFVLGVG
jgi:hypothetical protein